MLLNRLAEALEVIEHQGSVANKAGLVGEEQAARFADSFGLAMDFARLPLPESQFRALLFDIGA